MNTPLAVTELLKKAEVAKLATEVAEGTALVRRADGSVLVAFTWGVAPTVAYLQYQPGQAPRQAPLGHVARALDALAAPGTPETERHDYEPGEPRHPGDGKPQCAICGGPKH